MERLWLPKYAAIGLGQLAFILKEKSTVIYYASY